jgi:hypothetical protein
MNFGTQHRITMECKDSFKNIRVILPNSIYSLFPPFIAQLNKVGRWFPWRDKIISLDKLF